LDNGECVEYDSPQKLLQKTNSVFKSMVCFFLGSLAQNRSSVLLLLYL
jgi:hypothetical protein